MEIERKFLLVNDDWRQSGIKGLHLSQGYLNEEGNTVRVRTADDKGI